MQAPAVLANADILKPVEISRHCQSSRRCFASASKCSKQHDAPAQQASKRDMMIFTSALVASQVQLQLKLSASASEVSPAASPLTKGLSKYIKQKQLDPLETYVPVVLQARSQLVDAGQVMLSDVTGARQLLRTGAFSGLRDNVRALGEYAVKNGRSSTARELVTGFFTALESYDFVLNSSIRTKVDLPVEEAEAKLQAAVVALDNLINSVPEDVIEKSREILSVTQAKAAAATQTAEEEAKALQQLLP